MRPSRPEMPPRETPPVVVPPAYAERVAPRPGRRFPFMTALIALVVVAVCGGVLYAFAGAKVTVTPHSADASVASDFSATAGQGDLSFQVVTVEKTATVNVPAESTVTANDPAQGTITISNKQAVAQPLIKNTRFETPDGLIFRIHDSVTIPAGGSITANVTADSPGDKYNVGPTTFTVPGLKGSKAYDLVTAASNAPMTGGFVGQRASASDATKQKQLATIQTTLDADLAKDLAAKIPQGYVLVPGASFTSYTPVPDATGPNNTVTIGEKGTVIAALLPSDALARAIAFKSIGTYGGQPVSLPNVQGLKLTPALPSLAPDATQFDFNLTGTTTVLWTVDPAKIAGAVAGKNRGSAEVALQSFPEVDKATLVLRPFWATTFPGDPAKIKVVVNQPQAAK